MTEWHNVQLSRSCVQSLLWGRGLFQAALLSTAHPEALVAHDFHTDFP